MPHRNLWCLISQDFFYVVRHLSSLFWNSSIWEESCWSGKIIKISLTHCCWYGSRLPATSSSNCCMYSAVLQAYLMIQHHTTCWCSHDVNLKTLQTCPTLLPLPVFPITFFPSPFPHLLSVGNRPLCCQNNSFPCLHSLIFSYWVRSESGQDWINMFSSFSHFPNDTCIYCLWPQGSEKEAPSST